MKRLTFVVNREGVARALDDVTEPEVGEFEPIEDRVDEIRQAERQSDGIDRVPYADEPHLDVDGVRMCRLEFLRGCLRGPAPGKEGRRI